MELTHQLSIIHLEAMKMEMELMAFLEINDQLSITLKINLLVQQILINNFQIHLNKSHININSPSDLGRRDP